MKKFLFFLAIAALIIGGSKAFFSTRYNSKSVGKDKLENVSIQEIIDNIDFYAHRAVTVSAEVADSYYLLSGGSYLLADAEGEAFLRVFTRSETPAVGTKILVVIEPKLLYRMNETPKVIATEVRILLLEDDEVPDDLSDDSIRL